MKKILMENGEEKVINCLKDLKDLPPITSNLLDVNLKLKPIKNIGGHRFGEPTFILFIFFIKFLPKIWLRKKIIKILWNMCDDIREIQNLHGIEFHEVYVLFKAQDLIKRKLELINKINSSLSQIYWIEKFFLKKMMKNFYKEINPLIYNHDITGKKSHRFGHSAHFLYDIFVREFKISSEEVEKMILKIENPH